VMLVDPLGIFFHFFHNLIFQIKTKYFRHSEEIDCNICELFTEAVFFLSPGFKCFSDFPVEIGKLEWDIRHIKSFRYFVSIDRFLEVVRIHRKSIPV
jgi:hypothetical protein